MGIEQIEQRKREIVERFGPWTANNIQLQGDIYTVDKGVFWCAGELKRFIQIISDIAGKQLDNLRVLDLGCLEALYSIELARHGAQVIAIEGREANIEKARLARDVLSLKNLELIQDDVRNLSKEKYGRFDVVLCLGILYHLDVPDVFTFLENIADVCRGFVIIDTHVSMTSEKCHVYNGNKFFGSVYIEHMSDARADEKEKTLWSSLDNITSFWFTYSSLLNLLAQVGFTSVYECHNPPLYSRGRSRITLLAIKGHRQTLFSMPQVDAAADLRWPERSKYFNAVMKLATLLPQHMKRLLIKLLW